MDQLLSIGYNNISITNDHKAPTAPSATHTLVEQRPIDRDALRTLLTRYDGAVTTDQRLLSFDFVVEAPVTDSVTYLDYFVPANSLALDRQDNCIPVYTRFGSHLATIEAESDILRFSMHYNRSNRKYGFSHSVCPAELLTDNIWHLCIHNVLDLLNTILVNVIEEIDIADIKSMSDIMKYLAVENLKSRRKISALKNDIERKYRNGLIANGNMTRLRKYTNTVVADSKTDVLLAIREQLAGMLPMENRSQEQQPDQAVDLAAAEPVADVQSTVVLFA